MKQHITVEQLNELSDKNKEKLWKWLGVKGYAWRGGQTKWRFICDGGCDYPECQFQDPLLSIGQMIEFLGDDYYKIIANDWRNDSFIGIEWGTGIDDFKSPKPEELCDILWQAVKERLEK